VRGWWKRGRGGAVGGSRGGGWKGDGRAAERVGEVRRYSGRGEGDKDEVQGGGSGRGRGRWGGRKVRGVMVMEGKGWGGGRWRWGRGWGRGEWAGRRKGRGVEKKKGNSWREARRRKEVVGGKGGGVKGAGRME